MEHSVLGCDSCGWLVELKCESSFAVWHCLNKNKYQRLKSILSFQYVGWVYERVLFWEIIQCRRVLLNAVCHHCPNRETWRNLTQTFIRLKGSHGLSFLNILARYMTGCFWSLTSLWKNALSGVVPLNCTSSTHSQMRTQWWSEGFRPS